MNLRDLRRHKGNGSGGLFRGEHVDGGIWVKGVPADILMQKIGHELVGVLEKLEGRVPSDPEIKRFASRSTLLDGWTVYRWKGKRVLRSRQDVVMEGGHASLKLQIQLAERHRPDQEGG